MSGIVVILLRSIAYMPRCVPAKSYKFMLIRVHECMYAPHVSATEPFGLYENIDCTKNRFVRYPSLVATDYLRLLV